MSKQYRRSLLTFYLAAPPRRGDRGEDFRTLPLDRSAEDEAAVDALVRDLRTRQSLVRSLLEDEDDSEPLAFVGSASMRQGVDSLVESIRRVLQIDLTGYRAQGDYDDAFAYLRQRAESAGIFVLLVGDLGSYHSAIPVEAFRGFAIADPIAPFVVINDQDSRVAWSFTLLHEVAHLFLGTTGISASGADKAIEQFCNDVAGEFLLPAAELDALGINGSTAPDDAINRITVFARERCVSRQMVAYKLHRARRISIEQWRTLSTRIHELATGP